jgi:hypothetical protein
MINNESTGKQSPPSRQLVLGFRDGLADGWAVGGNETLGDLVESRTSGLGLFYVLLYIGLWGRYRDLVGQAPPSNLAHAKVLKMPHRTLFRYRQKFHDAFPELDDPGVLYDLVRPKVEDIEDHSPEVTALRLGGAALL